MNLEDTLKRIEKARSDLESRLKAQQERFLQIQFSNSGREYLNYLEDLYSEYSRKLALEVNPNDPGDVGFHQGVCNTLDIMLQVLKGGTPDA